MRLSAKLSIILSFLAAAVLAATMAGLYFAERNHLAGQMRQAQRTALEKLARVCADSVVNNDELSRLTYLRTFVASSEDGVVPEVFFLDDSGRILMHSDFLGGDLSKLYQPAQRPYLLSASKAEEAVEETVTDASGRLRVVSRPVRFHDRRVGTVAAVYDLGAIDRSLARLQSDTLVRFVQAGLFGLALSVLFALALTRALMRPIRELSEGAEKIGRGRFQHRIPNGRKDELGGLAREFNAMAGRLAELDELKESFLAQVTHDLRSPLSAVLGYVELLQMKVQGPLTAKQEESLATARASATYLAELIDNILDITKLEAGKMPIDPREVDLKSCSSSVFEVLRVKADEFGVKLDDSGVPAEVAVFADEEALTRVLMNLVSNALKFTPSGGKVSIEWSRPPSGGDRIGVRDTGIGIPEDKLKTLFQKFSQVAETKNKVRKIGGTGLGLVICKQIVEAHGGRIWVESAYRKGTSFFFVLPPRSGASAHSKNRNPLPGTA